MLKPRIIVQATAGCNGCHIVHVHIYGFQNGGVGGERGDFGTHAFSRFIVAFGTIVSKTIAGTIKGGTGSERIWTDGIILLIPLELLALTTIIALLPSPIHLDAKRSIFDATRNGQAESRIRRSLSIITPHLSSNATRITLSKFFHRMYPQQLCVGLFFAQTIDKTFVNGTIIQIGLGTSKFGTQTSIKVLKFDGQFRIVAAHGTNGFSGKVRGTPMNFLNDAILSCRQEIVAEKRLIRVRYLSVRCDAL
mmetsp:Transcript_6909/g.12411  ORF Transcript_6909/g.12411 Transcript_6909/m.12411 type:complete len:250 (+) Transcript_6909:210-959(+)